MLSYCFYGFLLKRGFVLEIVVGIIRTSEGQIFITQRTETSHLAGYWEFPGGKLKCDETPEEALKRELFEEIDIRVHQASYVTTIEHEYSDRKIRLHVYLVEQWDGEPYGKEGQCSTWIAQNDLNCDDFPEANRVIIEMLKN